MMLEKTYLIKKGFIHQLYFPLIVEEALGVRAKEKPKQKKTLDDLAENLKNLKVDDLQKKRC
ncbi:MAG: hypothetical protein CM15mP10_1710 [Actinomycetota bacterium]|nr:MAG: hypothetical protein CM15mP10_1710 [Actinomycetota bacterium]